MKKITFILLALISGTAFAQNSASTTATVNAEIVSPLKITKEGDLDFGQIAVGSVAGAVRVLVDATASYSVPEMKIPSNIVTPAKFKVTAEEGSHFGISIPATVLTGEGDDMPINFFHNLLNTQNIVGSEAIDLTVGGLLTVNANQEPGEYTGTVQVTVSYE